MAHTYTGDATGISEATAVQITEPDDLDALTVASVETSPFHKIMNFIAYLLGQTVKKVDDTKKYIGATGQPAFLNGWGVGDNANPPAFWKDSSGTVHLSGVATVFSASLPNTVAFQLPAGYRPNPHPGGNGALQFPNIDMAGTSAGTPIMWASTTGVDNNGNVYISGTGTIPPSGTGGSTPGGSWFLKLDGISFRADQ